MNSMKEVRLEKVTVNIGAGEPGPKLEKATKLLEKVTGATGVITKTHKRTTFGGARGRQIGVKTTLRGEKAKAFLKTALQANGNKVLIRNFDDQGNFSFGIAEYINIPGMKYDPEVGIIGMDVCITLQRPGFRIKRRALRKKKVGKAHMITKEEAMEWVKNEFGVEIVEKIEKVYY